MFADTTSMARISYDDPWKLYPRSRLLFTADGTTSPEASTGTPYLFLSNLSITHHDLELDNHASLTLAAGPNRQTSPLFTAGSLIPPHPYRGHGYP